MSNSENIARRVGALKKAVRESPARGAGAYATPYGEVNIASVEIVEDGVRSYADVYLHGETEGGDPHFRIVNPPMIATGSGERVQDPIMAIAETIGSLGGAARQKGRKGR